MSIVKMKSPEQNKAIFGLGSKLGFAKEDLEELALDVTGGRTERLSQITFEEANGIITRLGGDAFPENPRAAQRAKQAAGVVTIESRKQWNAIRSAWTKFPHRTASGLTTLCRRVIKKDKPITTAEGNKIFEAVKSMNAREEGRAA